MKYIKSLMLATLAGGIITTVATPAHAQISDRMKRAKPIISAPMKTVPCVNPNAPCPGEIFKLDVQKIKAMRLRDRDLKKYIMSEMREQAPDTSTEMLDGNSGLIIALLAAREVSDAEDIEMELIKWPPKLSLELKLKITFGK